MNLGVDIRLCFGYYKKGGENKGFVICPKGFGHIQEDKVLRKKSHISLAQYIVKDMEVPVMMNHRKAFYLGSILPDCKPSFLTQRHEFDGTFRMLEERICSLSQDAVLIENNERAYMRRLGEVIHYIADYFTYPHNSFYEGNLKDHCVYEKELKFRLREYVRSGEAFRTRIDVKKFETPEAVCAFIRKAHEEYQKIKHGVKEDCEFIVRTCHQVVQAIIYLISLAVGKEMTTGLLGAAV